MNYNLLSLIGVSNTAKQLALDVINHLSIRDTGSLGFWLNQASEKNDHLAIAKFVNEQVNQDKVHNVDDVVELLKQKLPATLFSGE